MERERTDILLEALEEQAKSRGYEIIDVEVLGSNNSPILRIYIDKDGGITLDDIAEAQLDWIEPTVDEIDPIESNFTLEISSPGIDRPLRKREHFIKAISEVVKIKTEPINGRKNFKGILEDVTDESVILNIDSEIFEIPINCIKKANIKGRLDF